LAGVAHLLDRRRRAGRNRDAYEEQ
jgi:hypothetical protein